VTRILLRDESPRGSRAHLPLFAIRAVARRALQEEGVARGELSILVTGDRAIRRLNARWRGKDASTNVLSFPGRDRFIGDVVISVETCARQGAETGSGFRYTFLFYLVHGILHLLGHDHVRPTQARRMNARTRAILEAAGEG